MREKRAVWTAYWRETFMQDWRRLHLYSIAYDVFSSIVKYSFALFIITLVHNCITLATHLLAISSSYYISVVHHLNQWQLLYLRVLSSTRYLLWLCRHFVLTRIYTMVCGYVLSCCMCIYMYTHGGYIYTWRATIFFYIYRMKMLYGSLIWYGAVMVSVIEIKRIFDVFPFEEPRKTYKRNY